MVNPGVTDWFRIKRQEMPIVKYTMSTMERHDAPHESRILHGMEIEPLINPGEEGSIGKMELPSCIESKNIPEALDEIPDREEVRKMPGLEHLAEKFPKKDGRWNTLLLLGRTCMEAMGAERIQRGKQGTPLAVQTPLGWALIGTYTPGMAEGKQEDGNKTNPGNRTKR